MPNEIDVPNLVRDLFRRYWPATTPDYLIEAEVRRYSENVRDVVSAIGPRGTVVDIGGGWGVFAAAIASLGFHAISIDDGGDAGWDEQDRRARLPKDYGYEFVCRDVVTDGIDFAPNSVDAFTSFDSVEHWHCSPKRVFHQAIEALRPGGLFLLSVPNSNDFVKRITVPLGQAEWAPFSEWYEKPVYRSHVHEATVNDLWQIAADLRLTQVRVYGRNSGVYLSRRAAVRAMFPPVDAILRLRASLCTEIYLAGVKG
jgi:SAM-dependent methyltransferase